MQRIGYMIYETAEGEKNRRFVSMFAQAGKAYGPVSYTHLRAHET